MKSNKTLVSMNAILLIIVYFLAIVALVHCDDAVSSNEEPLVPYQEAPGLVQEPLQLLKANFQLEYRAHPNLYDPRDVANFFDDNSQTNAIQFLIQRRFDWRGAYHLASKTLRWRAKMGINQLEPSDFPCDLFKLGLIFEEGKAYKRGPSGEYLTGNPVIWIRLGALGSVVRHMEGMKPVKAVAFALDTAGAAASKVRDAGRKIRRSRKRNKKAKKSRKMRKAARAVKNDMSVSNDGTIRRILLAVSWWLNDWRSKHQVGAQATLVLDFEDTDFAMSSWSMGEFFVKLDDHFPNLFDQIIGFRFKPKLWSLRSPISMLNRIFKSRISSSIETDRKMKFVKKEPQMNEFMERVSQDGFSLLPVHVRGECMGPVHKPPEGCQAEAIALADLNSFNPATWQAIHSAFYSVCRPRQAV